MCMFKLQLNSFNKYIEYYEVLQSYYLLIFYFIYLINYCIEL